MSNLILTRPISRAERDLLRAYLDRSARDRAARAEQSRREARLLARGGKKAAAASLAKKSRVRAA